MERAANFNSLSDFINDGIITQWTYIVPDTTPHLDTELIQQITKRLGPHMALEIQQSQP